MNLGGTLYNNPVTEAKDKSLVQTPSGGGGSAAPNSNSVVGASVSGPSNSAPNAEAGRPNPSNNESYINQILDGIKSNADFNIYYIENICFRRAVNLLYNEYVAEQNSDKSKSAIGNLINKARDFVLPEIPSQYISQFYPTKANLVYINKNDAARNALKNCLRSIRVRQISEVASDKDKQTNPVDVENVAPFDIRLERIENSADGSKSLPILSFSTAFKSVSISGYVPSPEGLAAMMEFKKGEKTEKGILEEAQSILDGTNTSSKIPAKIEQMKKDEYFHGVPSLINTYSMTRLYGSRGGQYLVDRVRTRKWYEIDEGLGTDSSIYNYSKNPTTTSIINWGGQDPYGRTPFHYSDFVFCKDWGIVPNNRMIVLRRYPAPIIDNLNFPGMDGVSSAPEDQKNQSQINQNLKDGNKGKKTDTNIKEGDKGNPEFPIGNTDQGSSKPVVFPPMATAITYFGEETENKLSSILKFTSGLKWEEIESDVHTVMNQQNPNMDAGPGGLSSGLVKFARALNMVTGDFNSSALLNKESLPPDPYTDGPYENRVIGPVNAITKVWKRGRGIEYTNELSLTFNYIARPIGGVNTKAALLDILSNFLVIGSASAMFWGGQHRFMGNPQGYPFIGGSKGMAAWYRGDPIGWGRESLSSFADQAQSGLTDLIGLFKDLISTVFSGASWTSSLFNVAKGDKAGGEKDGSKALSNAIRAYSAEKSSGTIPYLTGFKALLTGEPVGEWHVTIGNPLNPIAMIGNLICKNIEVEFGDELGPDDFPLELKIKVNLEHGMARDRDAIQSIFNRGMGRIYDLPNQFIGSADVETKVDKNTGQMTTITNVLNGRSPKDWWSGVAIGTGGGATGKALVKQDANDSKPSVWPVRQFKTVSADQIINFKGNIKLRSQFTVSDWIAKKAIK